VGSWSRVVRPATFVCAVAAVASLGLAAAIALGVVSVPNLAQALSDAVDTIGWWVFAAAPALILLETCVFAGWLIHGELVLLAGGFAVAEEGLPALAVLIVLVWAAAVLGDVISLTAGRALGRSFLERRAARTAAVVDAFFARHGGKALFLGRFTGLLRSTMPFVAGASGVTVRRLVPFSLASGIVWAAAFLTIGYVAAESFERVGDAASRIALVALLVVSAALIVRARMRPRDSGDAPATACRPSA
jgi:membrane protein DedA with SNARE-associated domain